MAFNTSMIQRGDWQAPGFKPSAPTIALKDNAIREDGMLRIPTPFRTKYVNERGVLIEKGAYALDGSPRLVIKSALGEPLLIATVCLGTEKPRDGHVFIKSWSENEGVWEELHRLGVIGKVQRIIEVGPHQVDVYECPILKDELK